METGRWFVCLGQPPMTAFLSCLLLAVLSSNFKLVTLSFAEGSKFMDNPFLFSFEMHFCDFFGHPDRFAFLICFA